MMVSLCHGNQGICRPIPSLLHMLIRASGIMPFFPANYVLCLSNYAPKILKYANCAIFLAKIFDVSIE